MVFFRVPFVIQSFYKNRKWTGDNSKSVYLTFDDGPDGMITPWLLDILKKEKIQATFFCVGSQVAKYPSTYKKIVDLGHRVGNHTYNHEKGTKTPADEYMKSIKMTDELIDSNLFRPPYGRMTKRQERLVLKSKKKIIMWSWISHDYNENMNANTIIKKAVKIKGGDILLFHNNLKSKKIMMSSLPEVIKIIRDKGLTFNTLTT